MQATEHNQTSFAKALLNPAAPIPHGLVGANGLAQRRFRVYRNNVVVGLVDALRDTFPAIQKLVGEEFFAAVARVYVMANPPNGPVLLEYGDGFPAFLREFGPVKDLPYLADVAAIDRALVKAYHAADKLSLDGRAFLSIETEISPFLHFALHPSVQVIPSRFPAFTIWRANSTEKEVKEISLNSGGEDTLVLRPAMQVEVRLLRPGSAPFLIALHKGKSLQDATLEATDERPDFDLDVALPALIDAGTIVAFEGRVPITSRLKERDL